MISGEHLKYSEEEPATIIMKGSAAVAAHRPYTEGISRALWKLILLNNVDK